MDVKKIPTAYPAGGVTHVRADHPAVAGRTVPRGVQRLSAVPYRRHHRGRRGTRLRNQGELARRVRASGRNRRRRRRLRPAPGAAAGQPVPGAASTPVDTFRPAS